MDELDRKPVADNQVEGMDGELIPEVNVDELMAKYDKESSFRRYKGIMAIIISIIALAFAGFQLYTAQFGIFTAQIQRPVHLCFALVLAFLLYPARKKSRKRLTVVDVILALATVAIGIYMVVNVWELFYRAGDYTTMDLIVGAIGIFLVIEATRRVVGLPIVIIGLVFLLYNYFGKYIPGFLQHRGFPVDRIVGHMWFTTEGILGIPLGVSSTFIFLFIMFGAFLEKTGIGKFFIDIANAVAGKAAGGPAKVAVITSALEGTVSGSSVANTVGSGSFTIPMMIKLGYKREFAGAVEAAASTGGQIMPPIMGAAAFLMSEFTNTPYVEIAKSAVIPALLFFAGIFITVHLEAKKTGLKGMSKEEIPSFWALMKRQGYLFLPLVAIIYMLVEGRTPTLAALFGIYTAIGVDLIATLVVAIRQKKLKATMIEFFWDCVKALENGARGAVGVALACAAAGIIVGTVTLTGLGLKMADGLVTLAGGKLLLTLFFTMITSLILGMGAPTTANYVITSTIAAPALIKLGVPMLAAHMFVFYFGIVADITPPVALAAFAGAGIAKANPLKTGVHATKLAIAAFLVPYFFVYSPSLLMIDTNWIEAIRVVIGALLGMVCVGAATEGWFLIDSPWWERIIFLVGGLLLIEPSIMTDLIGAGLMVFAIFLQVVRRKKRQTPTPRGAAVA
jgi:TRAP transporter 4TM/12TM fusion protein